MAKYVIEFDTLAKTLSVTKDGTAIENVRSVDICQKMSNCGCGAPDMDDYSREFAFGLSIGIEDEAAGEQSWTRVTATELAPSGWVTFTVPGLSVAPTSLEERIGALLGARR